MKSLFGARNLNLKATALVAYRAASDLIGKGAFLLITVAAARRLTQDTFGIFSVASTVGWMTAIATDFGMQLHLARAIARQPERAGTLLRGWLTLRLWTAALAVAATAAAVWSLPAARPYAAAMLLLTSMYVVSGLIEFLHYFYRGLSRTDLESTLTLGQRLATLVLAIAVLWLRPDITLLAAVMLVPVAVTFLYSLRLAFSLTNTPPAASADAGGVRRGSDPINGVRPPSDPTPVRAAREWRRDVMPIGAGIVLSALYFRVDVLLVELWSGTQAVALYNAVFRLVEALRLFPAAVLAVALPVLCRAANMKPLIQVSAVVTVLALLATAFIEVLAPWLVAFLYGSQYATAVTAFRILLLAFPLMSLNYALTHQLIGWNGHRAYALICAAALVFNIALNAFLIPSLSIAGAAWSTLWTELLLSTGCVAALAIRTARAGTEAAVLMEVS